jgi:hypothetical protein
MIEPPPSTDAVQAPLKDAPSEAAEERNVLFSPRSRRFGSGRSSRKRYASCGYGLYFKLSGPTFPCPSRGFATVSPRGWRNIGSLFDHDHFETSFGEQPASHVSAWFSVGMVGRVSAEDIMDGLRIAEVNATAL